MWSNLKNIGTCNQPNSPIKRERKPITMDETASVLRPSSPFGIDRNKLTTSTNCTIACSIKLKPIKKMYYRRILVEMLCFRKENEIFKSKAVKFVYLTARRWSNIIFSNQNCKSNKVIRKNKQNKFQQMSYPHSPSPLSVQTLSLLLSTKESTNLGFQWLTFIWLVTIITTINPLYTQSWVEPHWGKWGQLTPLKKKITLLSLI